MNQLPAFLANPSSHPPLRLSREEVRMPFLEKGIRHLARIVRDGYAHWESSRREGLLQGLDPRVKVLFVTLFLVVTSLKRHVAPQAGMFLFIFLLYAASRLDLLTLYRRILSLGLLFGILIPLPSTLNIVSGGEMILPLIQLPQEHRFWIYDVPSTIGVTREGLHGISILALRVTNSVALSLLVLYTTSFADLIKALRLFRMPDTFVTVITLSYKYLFAFTRTIEDMHLAKKSRQLRQLDSRDSRLWAAGRLAFLFQKTQSRCEEIFKAMISRGFEQSITLHPFRSPGIPDVIASVAALALAACFLAW